MPNITALDDTLKNHCHATPHPTFCHTSPLATCHVTPQIAHHTYNILLHVEQLMHMKAEVVSGQADMGDLDMTTIVVGNMCQSKLCPQELDPTTKHCVTLHMDLTYAGTERRHISYGRRRS